MAQGGAPFNDMDEAMAAVFQMQEQVAALNALVQQLQQQQHQQPQHPGHGAAPAFGAPAAPAAPRPIFMKPDPFTGEGKPDWVAWRFYFESLVDLNQWDDLTARRALPVAMRGAAADAVKHVLPHDFDNLGAMLHSYQDRFLPQSNSELSRCEFETCKQGSKETLLAYHSRLQGLFARAYPDDFIHTSPTLIRQFCLTVHHHATRQYLFLKRCTTYSEVLDEAQAYTASIAMTSYSKQGGHSGGNAGEAMDVNALDDSLAALEVNDRERKCFFCDRNGHIKKECFKYQRYLEQQRNPGRGQSSSSPAARQAGRGRTFFRGRPSGNASRGAGDRRVRLIAALADALKDADDYDDAQNAIDSEEDDEVPEAPPAEEGVEQRPHF